MFAAASWVFGDIGSHGKSQQLVNTERRSINHRFRQGSRQPLPASQNSSTRRSLTYIYIVPETHPFSRIEKVDRSILVKCLVVPEDSSARRLTAICTSTQRFSNRVSPFRLTRADCPEKATVYGGSISARLADCCGQGCISITPLVPHRWTTKKTMSTALANFKNGSSPLGLSESGSFVVNGAVD